MKMIAVVLVASLGIDLSLYSGEHSSALGTWVKGQLVSFGQIADQGGRSLIAG